MEYFERSDIVPTRTQHVPQNIETPVTFVPVPNGYVRFVYSRSSDSMSSQIEGQDYLCFQHNDQKLALVVCDGVGSSFSGNLAARILGDNLLEWLWLQEIPRMGSASALSEAATAYLNKLQKQAQIEVEEYEIPDTVSGLIRQALESQRAYGSEAIFAACRIDHPSVTIPDGLVSIIWMGDTHIRVFDDADGDEIKLEGDWANANRWSTVQGVRGTMNAWMHPLNGIGRIASFTDGLNAYYDDVLTYSDTKLDHIIRADSKLPTSDDVSFIDVVLRTPNYEGYAEPDLPDLSAERPHLQQVWNPGNAGTYKLQWNWSGQQKASFLIQEDQTPALIDPKIYEVPMGQTEWAPPQERAPGAYYYRVRAVTRRGTVTPWSELRQTKVAFPPPSSPSIEPVNPEGATVIRWSEEGDTLDYILEQSQDETFEDLKIVFEGRSTEWAVPVSQYEPGTYYYRVKALSDGGQSPYSKVEQVEIALPPPPRPQLGSISYDQYKGEYLLRWQPSVGATYYEVRESSEESEEDRTFEVEESIYAVNINDMPVGEYIYQVRACHKYGCSEWSNEQAIIIAPPVPGDPPELTIDGPDSNGLITVSWAEVEFTEYYLVEVAETDQFQQVQSHRLEEPLLGISRREPGALYIRAAGQNAGGRGPWSAIEVVTLSPNKPGWIEAESNPDESNIQISWGAVGGGIEYRLQTLTGDPQNRAMEEIYLGEETHAIYQVDSKTAALLHFRVRAEAGNVSSEWQVSDPVEIEHTLPPPSVMDPPFRKITGEIELKWYQVVGATHYLVEVARDDTFDTIVKTEKSDHSRTEIRVQETGTLYFRVRACKDDQCSQPGPIVSIKLEQVSTPRLWPVDPVKEDELFEIVWAGTPDSSYYVCEESTEASFVPDSTRIMGKVFHPSQKIAIPPKRKGTFYYRVKSVDAAGQESGWSNVIAVDIV